MVECSPATRAARVRFPADARVLHVLGRYLVRPTVQYPPPPDHTITFTPQLLFHWQVLRVREVRDVFRGYHGYG